MRCPARSRISAAKDGLMTILQATNPLTAVRAAATTAAAAAPATPDAAMGSLFQADLAKASQDGAASAEKTGVTVPEKSISYVYRGSKSGVMSPTQQFESFVLRSFVESMLPQENSEYFGTGTAGKIWKSMLAERIGDEMAKDGGIGIAEMLGERGSKATALEGAQHDMTRSESLSTSAQALKGIGSI
jgi:flagellar protein FlgJ